MKRAHFKKFKKGAASFYIVAVSTLILVIVAASFAAVIVSEVTRTSNDDLAQSAYDSALAGVEDAKLTFYNYQKCKNGQAGEGSDPLVIDNGGVHVTCSKLIDWVERGEDIDLGNDASGNKIEACDIVANSLGRTITYENGSSDVKKGVLVQEKNENGNNMEQYYTCVIIKTKTEDYLGELDSEDTEHSVRIRFDKDKYPNAYRDVSKVRVSWHSFNGNAESGGKSGNLFSWMPINNNGVFDSEKKTPAVIGVSMVQTAGSFYLNEFDESRGNETNRGTVYLVPVKDIPDPAGTEREGYYTVASTSGSQVVDNAHGFLKSNDKNIKNRPVLVWCSSVPSQDYACTADIEIPAPIGGANNRNEDTFIFSVSLPYGGPKTDYRLEFLDAANNTLPLDGVQVSIDSTGRANDLYRRVDTRMEPADATFPYPIYGIEALNPSPNSPGIIKNLETTCEYNFEATCN